MAILVNEQTPLTDEQRGALESMLRAGHVTGVTSVYWELIDSMGDDAAPNKDQISVWMRERPEVQVHRMVKKVDGKKNSGGPIVPPAVVMSYIAADTLFVPAAFHTDKKVYKAAILYVCALTKYVFVLPCNLQNKDRPMSTTAQKGFEEFISRIRRAANDDSLHPLRIRTDNGSEFLGGACKAWLTSSRINHPGFYEHTTTTGSRSAGNPFAERAIQSWRRLLYAQYRAVEKQWDEQAVPRRQRRFNWVPYCDIVTQQYNERRHSTIRAKPADAVIGTDPTYVETRQQIVKAAQKAYGGLEVDRRQPAFSSRSNRVLKVGDLVRTLIIKKGPGLSTWNAAKSNKVSAGNNWSDDIFIVARVHAAQTMGNSTYTLAERDDDGQPGAGKKGVWTRQQLQHIPPETIQHLPVAPVASPAQPAVDDDDGDDDNQFHNASSAHPRPEKRSGHRYRVNDVLFFKKNYFVGAVGGLEAPALRRDRTGVVLKCTREHPNRVRKGAFLYTILFDDPPTTVERLPARGADGIDPDDENVEFLNDAAV